LQALIRVTEAASDKVGILGSLLIVPLVLSTCYEVFARYLFDSPTIWAYEVGFMLTGSHFLLGLAFTLRAGEHIRIDIFSGKFTARTRAVVDLAGYAVLLPMLVWLTLALSRYFWSGYASNEKSGQSAFNMAVWPFRLVFLAAFLLLTLQVLAEVIKLAQSLRSTPEGG
jgi:TRAP-type mannitol/chloroaromatic compound transport system permease small subunit